MNFFFSNVDFSVIVVDCEPNYSGEKMAKKLRGELESLSLGQTDFFQSTWSIDTVLYDQWLILLDGRNRHDISWRSGSCSCFNQKFDNTLKHL